MQKLAIVFLLISNVYLANSQDRFASAIGNVCHALNFELTTGEIGHLESPDSFLVELFKECSAESELAELGNLDFSTILEVRLANLKPAHSDLKSECKESRNL